ncbi:hypothetical protein K7432_016746 [Basidiobolus ranarum]|uniref:Uncharacterized protein n=1 Tax=Basidiobolus ranarum TaxID=34480 RepID=A0ABR2VL80_9FUNG
MKIQLVLLSTAFLLASALPAQEASPDVTSLDSGNEIGELNNIQPDDIGDISADNDDEESDLRLRRWRRHRRFHPFWWRRPYYYPGYPYYPPEYFY